MAVWLPQPVMFDTPMNRDFDCEGLTADECRYYKVPWRNWYVSDLMFAEPTVAFFMCILGVFVLGYLLTQLLASSRRPAPPVWRRIVAATRYLSYRGFRIDVLGWNSAPVGVLALGVVGALYFFCMDLIPSPHYWPGPSSVWGGSPPIATRSGWLALGCMPLVLYVGSLLIAQSFADYPSATASKTNWITLVTGIPHEKLQVFHRWSAYAFLVLAVIHTAGFVVWHIRNHDMVNQFTVSNVFEYWTGVAAIVFQGWLTLASWGPIRSLGYEFFKAAHFISVLAFVVIFFWHCSGTLTSWNYFVATAAVYVPCWAYAWLRTLFEYGTRQKAQLFVEDCGFLRISVPANCIWTPGQHCFLRFWSLGLHALSSHPFTICSTPSRSADKPSEMVFYIRHRGGLTATLYNLALEQPGVQVPVLVDGPYGGIDNRKFVSSDRLLFIAGGSGAGWVLPFIEQLIRCQTSSLAVDRLTRSGDADTKLADLPSERCGFRRPRSLHLVLATREPGTRAWLYGTLNRMLSEYGLSNTETGLTVEIHLTGEAGRAEQAVDSLNSKVSESGSDKDLEVGKCGMAVNRDEVNALPDFVRSRPDLPSMIRLHIAEAAQLEQSVGVFVCGPLTMQHDVRNTVASENLRVVRKPTSGGVYLHLEHFSWA